jgi:hypothetical protein
MRQGSQLKAVTCMSKGKYRKSKKPNHDFIAFVYLPRIQLNLYKVGYSNSTSPAFSSGNNDNFTFTILLVSASLMISL